MNLTKILLFILISTATLFGQYTPAIKIAPYAARPSIVNSADGNVFMGWVQYDSSFSGSAACFTGLSSNGAGLFQPTIITGDSNMPPSFVAGDDKLLVLSENSFMEPTAGCHFFDFKGNPQPTLCPFGQGYVPVGFYLPDTSYVVAWKNYSGGISANRYFHNSWSGNALLYTTTVDNIYRVDYVPGKYSRILLWVEKASYKYSIYALKFSLSDQQMYNRVGVISDTAISEIFAFDTAVNSDSLAVVVWSGKKDNKNRIFRTRLFENGSVSEPEIISPDSISVISYAEVSISYNSSGESVVAYEASDNPYIQRFDAQGKLLGAPIPILKHESNTSSYYPVVSLWKDRIHAAWTEYTSDQSDVWYQVLDFNNPLNAIDDRKHNNEPVQYYLAQNYPNPFNPATTIQYTVPSYGPVNIAVYNVLGKKVATLVNEAKSPGEYTITFHADDLATGIYYYVFRTNNFTSSKKMVILK